MGKNRRNNWRDLLLTIGVVVSAMLLWWGGYYLFNRMSPFSVGFNFITTGIIVLGFYVGAGFTFKKISIKKSF